MSPFGTTQLANAICGENGAQCHYEQRNGKFEWAFYLDGKREASTKCPRRAIEIAGKIVVDSDK